MADEIQYQIWIKEYLQEIADLTAQVESLKHIINKAHDVLMDAQPHIQQGIDHGDATAEFLDAHIDIAILKAQIAESVLRYKAKAKDGE